MMELFDGWKFLAGLGIFMFGIFMMEESIKLLAGRSFKIMIRRFTGTKFKGLTTGIVSTAILQSSSAVSLMVLAFVGAGLMTLVNAITVIMGASVGTTLTAWIVAVFGFKFKIDAFALPMIGIGGIGLIFLARSPRYVNISKLLAAFGFLFLGLDFMKTSVEGLAAAIDLSSLPDLGLWVYVFAGILLTAIMQSSSATIAVILTTLFSGIIDFPQGAAMVIGANVGTTVTILLGAIGGIPVKKQAAVSSLIFNAGTAAVAGAALPVMFWFVQDFFGFSDNPVLGIAAFHTLFNVLGVLIFFPLAPALARLLERMFPEKQRVLLTRYIQNTPVEVPEAAIPALRREVRHQLALSMGYIDRKYRLHTGFQLGSDVVENGSRSEYSVSYEDLENLHAAIFTYYAQIQGYEIDAEDALMLEPVIRSSRSIMNATKNLYEHLSEIEDIGKDENPFMTEANLDFKDRLKSLTAWAARVVDTPDGENLNAELKEFFDSVEAADKRFIRLCAKAVSKGTLREHEVTRLLMANRFFTQSSRMLVLSMQALTAGPPASKDRVNSESHDNIGVLSPDEKKRE